MYNNFLKTTKVLAKSEMKPPICPVGVPCTQLAQQGSVVVVIDAGGVSTCE
jgi:hypothetical protein